MNRSCVVVGAGGHARAVLALLRGSTMVEPLLPQFVADIAPTRGAETIMGHPVLPLPSDIEELRARGITTVVLAVGSNELRHKYFDAFDRAGFALPNVISARAFVDESAQLGRGNVIAHGVHIGPCVRIGNDNIINTNANVEHECTVGDHCHLAPGSILCGRVSVDDECMVGAGGIVIEGRRLAQRVLVAAGAVVVSDSVRSASRLVGVPAREVAEE